MVYDICPGEMPTASLLSWDESQSSREETEDNLGGAVWIREIHRKPLLTFAVSQVPAATTDQYYQRGTFWGSMSRMPSVVFWSGIFCHLQVSGMLYCESNVIGSTIWYIQEKGEEIHRPVHEDALESAQVTPALCDEVLRKRWKGG